MKRTFGPRTSGLKPCWHCISTPRAPSSWRSTSSFYPYAGRRGPTLSSWEGSVPLLVPGRRRGKPSGPHPCHPASWTSFVEIRRRIRQQERITLTCLTVLAGVSLNRINLFHLYCMPELEAPELQFYHHCFALKVAPEPPAPAALPAPAASPPAPPLAPPVIPGGCMAACPIRQMFVCPWKKH